MRLAVLVALDGSSPGGVLAPGVCDPWLKGAFDRLGFQVVGSLDAAARGATLLVHVAGHVEEASKALRRVSERVSALAPDGVLFLAELTHSGPPDESFVAAEHVEAAREALGAKERGYSAIVAVRPVGAQLETHAFTQLVMRAAREVADELGSAPLSKVVDRLRHMPERHMVAQGYAHIRGASDFELGPSKVRSMPRLAAATLVDSPASESLEDEAPAFEPLLALADGARDQRQWEQAVAGYRAALLVAPAASRGQVHARLGAVERTRGNAPGALRSLEKAREAAPHDVRLLEALVSVTTELADWNRYVKFARELVNHVAKPGEKVDLLFSIAKTLGQDLRDLPSAVRELEKARQIEPKREEVLEALRRGYRVLGEWKKLIEITGVLADTGPSDAERSARRYAQARIALDKLVDQELAIAFLDLALTEDATNDEAVDLLVELRTGRGEVAPLRRALEELVDRYEELNEWDRMRDVRRCIEALPCEAPLPAVAPVQDVQSARLELESLPSEDALPDDSSGSHRPRTNELAGEDLLEELEEDLAVPSVAAHGGQDADVQAEDPRDVSRVEALHAHPHAYAFETVDDESPADKTGPLYALPSGALPSDALDDIDGLPPSLASYPMRDGGPAELDLAFGRPLPLSPAAGIPAARMPPPRTILPEPLTPRIQATFEIRDSATRESREMRVEPETPRAEPVALRDPTLDLPIVVAGETGLLPALANANSVILSEDDGPALLELEDAVAKSPLDEVTHARLFELHVRAGRPDRAYLSALALEELGAIGPEHVAALEDSRSEGPLRLRALLDGAAWESMRAPGSDDVVEALFGAVAEAALGAQLEDRRARRKLATLDPERKQSQSSTVSIVASFHFAARVLGVQCPELYVHDEVPGDIAAVPAAEPSTVLGPRVLSGLSTKELAFLAARHLTYYRREHLPLVHFSTLPELTMLVLACVQMELPSMPIPQSVAASVGSLRGRIARRLAPADRSAMAAAVQRLESRGGRLDLAAWVRSVELTSARAGLFLSGDLRAAMARLRADAGFAGTPAFEAARADLIAFTASRAHADLRADFALSGAPRSSVLRAKGERGELPPPAERSSAAI
jgi:tetratricopeptide (TPR) repeat protein